MSGTTRLIPARCGRRFRASDMMTSVRFRHELSYEASPATVFEMLADPAFRKRVGEALDVVSADITLARDGDGFTLVNDQVQRTAGLPSFARKFAGDTTRVIQREEWTSATRGTLQVETPGKPTSMSGTIELVPDGDGTTEVVEIEVRAKVPLIGGRLENLMQQQVRDGMDTEREVGQAWLKGHRG